METLDAVWDKLYANNTAGQSHLTSGISAKGHVSKHKHLRTRQCTAVAKDPAIHQNKTALSQVQNQCRTSCWMLAIVMHTYAVHLVGVMCLT